jgi:hypothetical protein
VAGAGHRATAHFALGPRCASFDGYTVRANVSLAAQDRSVFVAVERFVGNAIAETAAEGVGQGNRILTGQEVSMG